MQRPNDIAGAWLTLAANRSIVCARIDRAGGAPQAGVMRIVISLVLILLVFAGPGCSKKKKKEESQKPKTEHPEKRRIVRGDVENPVPNRPLVRRTRPRHHPPSVRPNNDPYRRRYLETQKRLKNGPRNPNTPNGPRPPHLANYRGPRLANHPPRSPYRTKKYRRYGHYRKPYRPSTPDGTKLPSKTKTVVETNDPPEPKRVGPPLSISKLISEKELVTIVGRRARFRQSSLMGQEVGPGYNVLYFQPTTGKHFGVAIQVWKSLSQGAARRKYASLKRTFPNVENVTDLEEKAFLAVRNELVFLNVSLPTAKAVISVACSRALCPTFEILMGILKTVRVRALANL